MASLSRFFFRLEAIGIGLLVLALIAIPWLLPAARGVTELRDGFVRTFGLLTFVLIVLLAYAGLAIVRRRYDQAFASWRPWAIGLTVMVLVAGLLGFFRPAWQLGDVFLDDVTAGGNLGHQLATTPAGLLLWLASGIAVFALISPAGAAATARKLGTGARAVWGSDLPLRAWRSVGALTNLVFPTRVPPQGTDKVPFDSVMWAQQSEPKAGEQPAGPDDGDEPSVSEAPADVGEQARMPLDGDDEHDLDAAPGGRRKAHDGWRLPALDMLIDAKAKDAKADGADRARLITDTLASFGVDARVVQVNEGPTVTQFGIEPGWEVKTRRVAERDASGRPVQDADGITKMRTEEVSRTRVRVNQITTLANDLALALAAPSLRIESPVPGKPFVGIEVPNSTATLVTLRGVVESSQFKRLSRRTRLGLALGTSVSGEPSVADLAKMPHLLIAGATGSGKSVCINAIIACILMHASPEEVRFVMIDPKRVELAAFAKIPHLAFSSIITEVDQVVGTLQAVIHEMESRYRRFASISVRNIETYNRHPECPQKLPSWVLIIDELADLMMAAPYEVERQICRLAQLARATGIHLIVATQRPSVDVVTGLIKANFPTRIAFAMASQVDSRTILDGAGAEKLLGRGDMLYLSTDASKPTRLQGVYVSDEEIEQLVQFWTQDRFQNVERETFDHLLEEAKQQASELPAGDDPMFERAQELAEQHQRVSASMLQRRLRIGYPRAARLMDMLEARGVVGPAEGQGSRAVISGEEAAPEAVASAAPAGAPSDAADTNTPE
ncbi:MAG: DNA translocase FtsK [Chloroflexi bacterium]|nr:DNA translocase FtsK [Chloroflexota bacterium]